MKKLDKIINQNEWYHKNNSIKESIDKLLENSNKFDTLKEFDCWLPTNNDNGTTDEYIFDKRKLSKKHIFDFELKYRPMLIQGNVFGIGENTKLTLRMLDGLVINIPRYLKDNTFDFLDSYKDLIKWSMFLESNYSFLKKDTNIYKIVEKFEIYFDDECWKALTKCCCTYPDYSYQINFIKKYKNKVDWDYLSTYVDFDLDFISEMKDYINFDQIFKNMKNHGKLKKQIKLFTLNELDTVLSYKEK